VYLGSAQQPDLFLGAMLTHSSGYGNIPMRANHFEKNDCNGNAWKIQFEKTCMVNELLHKKEEWQPFKKVGQLTIAGLQFIRSQLGGKTPAFSSLNAD
jgi:hypothetical protein